MKKLVLLAMVATVLTIINGCQKDDLVSQLADEQLQAAVKPDVYLENGYLAFKNMETVDSVIQMLSKFKRTEKEAWEKQIGLKSARSEFDKLFEEYDKLESYQDFLAFKKRNSDKLKFNETDPDDCSIDYPFATGYFLPVLNNNGIYQVGTTIVKYTKDDQYVILDGDVNKLNNLDSYQKDDGIVKLKYEIIRREVVSIHNFPEDNPNGDTSNPWHRKLEISDRKLKNDLCYERYFVLDHIKWENNHDVNYYQNGILVYLNQRGQKVSWGKWRDYSTEYSLKEVRFLVSSFPEVQDGRTHFSSEVQPDINFYLHKNFVITTYAEATFLPAPTSVKFYAKVSFRGFGFNTTDYYNIENPEYYNYDGGYTYPSTGWGW